ncbi:RodZ family helix-turn-helix domain-containing protein [Arthrobacter pigmenti]
MTQIGGRSGRRRATIGLKVPAFPSRIPKAMLFSSGLLSASLMLSACAGATTPETAADNTESNASVYREAQTEELDTAVRHSPAAIHNDDDVQTAPANQNSMVGADSPADSGSTANASTAPDAPANTDPPAGPGPATIPGSGSFATLQDACEAVSAHMLSIAFAPLTYSYGGGRAEAKQAVSELPALRQKVPAGLQDDIARIESVFAASGGDYSKIDSKAFKQVLDPVEAWVTGNCPDL